jgi:eukaryotic-like serine/threonine-protein kinase
MTPERWQQVQDVLDKALELAPDQRSAYLNQACPSDPSLRQEVETLLASSDGVSSSFLQSSSPTPRVTVTPGAKLGEYEVKSLLGSGGMGEVYRARDSRLGRDVAIKVLPSLLSADSGRLRRFEQEARAAAALNHPNILAVHQMGTYEGAPYLVSELLEGETLREQIMRGHLAIRKAIDYGVQIAHGLAAAHEKGIVHRDLKPENLFVTKDGRVKILDFGLAKLTHQSSSEHTAPTQTEGTEPGVVMGTVGYMSPEQVRGQTADYRSDIFAFGAILYEMMTGNRAFHKPTSADTMSAILNEDPPRISQVGTNVPAALQRVVNRCVEKNPEQRFQSASDLAFALDALSESGAKAQGTDGKIAGRTRKRRQLVVSAAVVVLALSAGGYRYFHRKPKLTNKDTIVLSDFSNSTGDAIFDDTLKTALTVALRQSPFLDLLSDSAAAKTLQLMTRPAGTKLTPEITRELCQRAGSKAYIAGSIGSLGSEYVLGLKAVNCQSGDTLAEEQVTAASKEKVLDALGEAATKLRGELGESLATLQRFDLPLYEATTSSLEALKAYTLGRKALREKGSAASLPYFQHAVELDPNFAMGYWAVGNIYGNLGQAARGKEYTTKAFQLREHASEREKLEIVADYYRNVTGEYEKAAETRQEEIEIYPRDSDAYGGLGSLITGLGQWEKAKEVTRQALRLAPDELVWRANLTFIDVALQRFDEARQIIHEEEVRKRDDYPFHGLLYTLDFLSSNSAGMAEEQQWFAEKPEYETFGLALESATEADGGHLRKARELTKQAVDAAVRRDNKEQRAQWLADAAVYEAAYGARREAQQSATGALKLAPEESQYVEYEAALALAMAGETERAESLALDLEKRFPLNTGIQSRGLPPIRAQLALDRKNPAAALKVLHTASPLELGINSLMPNISCLYPFYVRGQAYLATGQGAAAATEFQGILDHSGIVGNCWTGALAHLGMARANALQARTAQGADADAARVRALAAYKDFLRLWKDADPDIPILKEAKTEYAKLQ